MPPERRSRRPSLVLITALVFGFIAVLALVLVAGYVLFAARTSQPTPTPTMLVQAPTSAPPVRVTGVPTAALLPTRAATAVPTPTPTLTRTPRPTLTPVPTITFTPTPEATMIARVSALRCVSIVGDSVAHGDAVFEIPATGYVRARFAPVGSYIAAQYRAMGMETVQVFNRTAPAAGISTGNHPSYLTAPEYGQLLQDGCNYTVILPWINDLTGGDAIAHADALAALVSALVSSNPDGRILLVNYYQGAPAPFALDTFAAGFTPERVNAFNSRIGAACAGGALALPQVNCIDANAAFVGMGASHLVGQMGRADFEANLITPVTSEEQGLLNAFFSANPNGLLLGDGVHLSSVGKAALAEYLVERMR